MQVHVLASDLTGTQYSTFLEMMLSTHGSFSLVWRDQLAFNESASAVRAALKRHELGYRRKDRWPGTRLLGKAGKALIVSYKADRKALPALSAPGSLYSWLSPNYPEDLVFYDDRGSCTFTSISHEKEAYVLDESTGLMLATLCRLSRLQVSDDAWAVLSGT